MGYGRHEKPNEGATNVWLTPKYVTDLLGPFDLDPCAAPSPRPWSTAATHFEEFEVDGLQENWFGNVWLNPPYGDKAEAWLHKLASHGGGIALIFARTETAWFQRVMKYDWLMFFPQGRLSFYKPDGEKASGNAGAPSVFLAIGDECKKRLLSCGVPGFYSEPKFYDFI
jgi:hypothetical protein